MRKLLNTLYVTTPEAYLAKDGLNVVVSVNKEERFRIPIINIEGIVTFGYLGASPGLMKLCMENNVSLAFMSPQGRFIGRVQGATKGNVFLRKKQYALSEDEDFSLHLGKLFVAGKIFNSRNVLRRFIRDNGTNEEVDLAAKQLGWNRRCVMEAESMDILRGEEGRAANIYFGVFDHLIIHQKSDFTFGGRSRRPPKDEVNAMLSFVYTLIANDVAAALDSVGLDPYVGFMHTLRPGRSSLALDLMEELRAYLGDRLVLSMINRKQVTKKDFIRQSDEGVLMTDSCRKELITQWQNRKKEVIEHPYLKEKISIGLLPYVQAKLLSRFLRNELDDYPVFLMK
ncbi:MAG: type I-C CRISPR-associated endonuclease Cas1c [Bacteroidales bacterium]|nr:type I-C CRISPR-associated endonuclease Cas1c [Bacteroidales bacterium]